MTTKAPKKPREETLPAQVARVLAEFELEGTDELVAAITVALAEAFEESPAYSRARLASEILGCLDRLQAKVDELEREREWSEQRDRFSG